MMFVKKVLPADVLFIEIMWCFQPLAGVNWGLFKV